MTTMNGAMADTQNKFGFFFLWNLPNQNIIIVYSLHPLMFRLLNFELTNVKRKNGSRNVEYLIKTVSYMHWSPLTSCLLNSKNRRKHTPRTALCHLHCTREKRHTKIQTDISEPYTYNFQLKSFVFQNIYFLKVFQKIYGMFYTYNLYKHLLILMCQLCKVLRGRKLHKRVVEKQAPHVDIYPLHTSTY